MAASYEAMRHFALPEAPLFEKCKAAIEAEGFSIVNADVAASRIVAKGGANWRSLGEQIELSVSGGGVHVRSTSAVSTTLFDWGRNKQNVEAIFRALQSLASESAAAGPAVAIPSPVAAPAVPSAPAPTPPATLAARGPAASSEIYVSYAWGGESEALVDRLDRSFQARGITVVRDKRALSYKADIRAFMERLGRGRGVIAVIGDKYLRSPHCMFELMQVAAHGDFHDRVFPIVLDDAQIYRPAERVRYIQHWEAQIRELDNALKGVSAANLSGFRDEIDQYTEIRRTIAELTSILNNMNTLAREMHGDSDFAVLIDAVSARLEA
ncbi:MAG: toll/interleukin-1 receptor domain-containing protein [Burkholderiaceae bacterium]